METSIGECVLETSIGLLRKMYGPSVNVRITAVFSQIQPPQNAIFFRRNVIGNPPRGVTSLDVESTQKNALGRFIGF